MLFPAPGRTVEQKVVAAGRRNFERPLGAFLALDFAEIRQSPPAARMAGAGREITCDTLEMIGELDQRARRQDLMSADAQAASGPQSAGQIRPRRAR